MPSDGSEKSFCRPRFSIGAATGSEGMDAFCRPRFGIGYVRFRKALMMDSPFDFV